MSDNQPQPHQTAFPEFVLDVDLPDGMRDVSNAAHVSPSWVLLDENSEDPIVTLWIDDADPAKRNPKGGYRFLVTRGVDSGSIEIETNDWSEAKRLIEAFRPFPGFEYGGVMIANPTVESSGRFEISPSEYGFEVQSTGGPGTAWVKKLPDGGHIILTDVSGLSSSLGKPGDTYLIGVYNAESDQVGLHHSVVGDLSHEGLHPDLEAAIPPALKFKSLVADTALIGQLSKSLGELLDHVERKGVVDGVAQSTPEAPVDLARAREALRAAKERLGTS